MAQDEALFLCCQKNRNFIPTLRIYDWTEPAFTIGYFQDLGRALDAEKTKKEGLKIVRRMTGGRAILHYAELTYSMVADSSRNPEIGQSLAETYARLSLAFASTLERLGIRVEYQRGKANRRESRSSYPKPCFASLSSHELSANGRKIMGSAQRRSRGCFIQQGSLPREKTGWNIVDYLPLSPGNGRSQHSWDEKVVSLQVLLGRPIGLGELRNYVKESFEKFFSIGLVEEGFTTEEMKLALKLEKEKYSQAGWNYFRQSQQYPSQPGRTGEPALVGLGCN